MKKLITNLLHPFATAVFRRLSALLRVHPPLRVKCALIKGIRLFARPFHTLMADKAFDSLPQVLLFRDSSPVIAPAALMPPTSQPTISTHRCDLCTEAPPCSFDWIGTPLSGGSVSSDTSSDGLLSFSFYHHTALRRSAHSRERFAPLNRLTGLTDSIPVDRPP